MNNSISKNEILFYIFIMLTYGVYLKALPVGLFISVFAPLVFLKFMVINKSPVPYLVLGAVFAAGAVFISKVMTIIFLLTVVAVPVIIYKTHSVKFTEDRLKNPFALAEASWLPVFLAPMPAAVGSVLVFILFPDAVEAFKLMIVSYIDGYASNLLKEMGATFNMQDFLEFLLANKEAIADRTLYLMPGYIYMGIALIAYFTERIGYQMSIFEIIKIPDLFLWLIVFGGGAVVLPMLRFDFVAKIDFSRLESISMMGYNALFMGGSLYFCRGFDVVKYNLARFRVIPIFRALFYFFILTNRILLVCVTILGVVSVFKNLTKKIEFNQDDQ